MKVLKTNDFVSEHIKIQPITNAELDAVQDKMKRSEEQLFVVWPDTFPSVNHITKYLEGKNIDSHKATNQHGQSLFILTKDVIKN